MILVPVKVESGIDPKADISTYKAMAYYGNPVVGFPWGKVNAPVALSAVIDDTDRFVATVVGAVLDVSKFQYASVPDDDTDGGLVPAAQRHRS